MEHFRPRSPAPHHLVPPVPVDEHGLAGPTPGQARGPHWRRTTPGRYVPVETRETTEQRILEQAQRLPPGGAVGGWASLRMHGAAYFDGRGPGGTALPVPLVVPPGRNLWPLPGCVVVRSKNPPTIAVRYGIPCVDPTAAVLFAASQAADVRSAVVVLDMALAAQVVRLKKLVVASGSRGSLQVISAIVHADARSLSPPETWLRLVWVLDAGLPRPRCNWEVADHEGRVLGCPDLLDPRLGLVAEYDGAAHRDAVRHRRDEERKELFRSAGLEVVTVVGMGPGDESLVARRLRAGADRARDLDRPRWWQAREGRLPSYWPSDR